MAKASAHEWEFFSHDLMPTPLSRFFTILSYARIRLATGTWNTIAG